MVRCARGERESGVPLVRFRTSRESGESAPCLMAQCKRNCGRLLVCGLCIFFMREELGVLSFGHSETNLVCRESYDCAPSQETVMVVGLWYVKPCLVHRGDYTIIADRLCARCSASVLYLPQC